MVMPIDAFPAAKQILTAAGLTVEREFDPDCKAPSSVPACALDARRDADGLLVTIYNPGDDFDGVGIARGDRTLIRIIAAER